MKRLIIALTVCAALLGACGDVPASRVKTVTTVAGPADTALPRQIIFAVDSTADEILTAAAENFCRKANSLAKGSFTLTAEKMPDPLMAVKSGKAGVIFLDGGAAEALHPYFAITNERFRYLNYENFSMTCNSERVLRKLSDVSRLNVFAAFYTGSNVLAGSGSPDEILSARLDAGEDAVTAGVGVLTISGSGTNDAFDVPGVMAAEALEAGERVDALYTVNRIAELSFSELIPSVIEAAAPEQTETNAPLFETQRVVVTRTFHGITPTWLILAPSLYESLSPVGRAAVDEARAYITGDVDGVYLKNEQERLDELSEAGIEISGDYKSTRNKLLRLKAVQTVTDSPDEKSFRDLLGRL